jgi:hypothetical protein
VIPVLLATLVAYIPTSITLLKRAAARPAAGLTKVKEVTLTGTVTVKDQGQHPAQLVLRFPLACKLEGEGGLSLSVRGTPAKPNLTAEGTPGPALQMLQLACPFLTARGLPAADAEEALRQATIAAGTDVASNVTSIGRMGDRVVYMLGAGPRDTSKPQLWLYKDSTAPARLLAASGAELRFLEYGNPAAADWFPRVIELWDGGQMTARFEAFEAKGARGTGEEEDDSQ